MNKCRACEYTSAIHKETVEKELQRLSKIKGIKICSDDIIISRLELCGGCRHFDDNGVCLMCGCYVRIRTYLKDNKCPMKKW